MDLRRCLKHGIPVNRCSECWPGFLRYLGHLCRVAVQTALSNPSS